MQGSLDAARPPPEPKEPPDYTPGTSSVLWAESALYGPQDFKRYNPDDLIGRKGVQVYKRMMTDEQIKAAAKFRRNAVTSRSWSLTFPEDALSETEAAERVRVLEYIIGRIPGSFRKALNYVMAALYQGFSITEKVYGPVRFEDRVYWGLASLRKKPFETFVFKVDPFGQLVDIVQEVGGQERKVDLRTVIHYAINPEEDEYYGQSELREAYRDFYSKDILTKLENIYLERMAGGLVWAQQQSGSNATLSTQNQAALQSVLSNIQTMTGIMMPKGWDLNVEAPKSTDAFERAINRHDRNMAKALLMPNLMGLTDSGQTGAYAQSKTQMEGFLWMLDSDAEDLAECINEQLIRDLCDVNWGDGVYPAFGFNPLSDSQKHAVLGLWKDMVAAQAVTQSDTDEAYIRELLGFPERAVDEEPDPAVPPAVPGQPGDDDPGQPGDPADLPDPAEPGDETLMGTDWTTIEYQARRRAFSMAQRRVNFAAIDRSSLTVEYQAEQTLGDIMGGLAAYLAEQVTDDALADPAVSNRVKVPREHVAALKKEGAAMLKAGWSIGSEEGKRELEKAGMARMGKAQFARFASIGDIAVKYFEAKAFQMAGNLTAEALKLFQSTLLNSIKYSKGRDETIRDIYHAFAVKGLLTEDQVVDALGEALGVENPSHRLRTVVRTNTFDAINEARFNFFTDQTLGGFVTALQYSAILDGRTTEICSTLDDVAMDAERWQALRPPNHFNCRSLLVPVTARDTDVAIVDEPPDVTPGAGFS